MRVLVEPGIGNVEVQPALSVADRSARHRIGEGDRQEMQGGMDAHALDSASANGSRSDTLSPGDRQVRALRSDMGDLGLGRIVPHGRRDRQRRAIGPGQRADIARLAAAGCIEHRAVEQYAAALGDAHDGRAALVR